MHAGTVAAALNIIVEHDANARIVSMSNNWINLELSKAIGDAAWRNSVLPQISAIGARAVKSPTGYVNLSILGRFGDGS